MKKTFLFFAIIAATVFAGDRLFGFLLEILYKSNRKGISGGDINYYLAQPEVDMLAIGSSRSRQHLIPDSISIPCFNLSHNGMGLGFQAALTDILDQNKKLPAKIVLLQIESDVIFSRDSSLNSDFQYLKFYYASNDYVRTQTDRINPFEGVKQYASCYKFNGQVPSLVKNSMESMSLTYINKSKGFEAREPSPNDSSNTEYSYKLAKKNDPENNCRIQNGSLGWEYLMHIKQICHKNSITLVCYTAPYYGKTGKDNASLKTKELLASKGIHYIDFSMKPMPELSSPSLWKDWTHLNSKGAGIFSGRLNDSLRSLSLY